MSLPEQTIEDMHRLNAPPDEEVVSLKAQVVDLKKTNAELKAKVDWYEEQHRLAQRHRFDASREHTPAGQENLFNEAEAIADPSAPEPDAEPESQEQTESEKQATVPARRKKAKGHRQQQLANLEIREIEHNLTDGPMVCQGCHQDMHFVDWEVTEKLVIEPPKAIRELHKQPVYACTPCQTNGEPAPIKMAHTMPAQAFPRSLASPSTVAYIAVQKFMMAIPLYRLEKSIELLGVRELSRQTMANWMFKAADVLAPIYGRQHEIIVTLDILNADETRLQVLHEPGRSATTDSSMWVYRSGREGPPIILYDYQTTRAGKHAKSFLTGFGGYDKATKQIVRLKYLQTDGHEGYSAVPHWVIEGQDKIPDVIQVGCWSHARRGFVDSAAIVKPKDRKAGKATVADQGVKYTNDLFDIERDLKDVSPHERLAARIIRSEPIISEMKKWLDQHAILVPPKTATGKAIAYCLNQWSKLTVFLQDGRLEIDNNRAERSIKPFVIGRKNWLFANTQKGARASATIYSIVETAKENGLIPFEYLKFLFEMLPTIDNQDKAAIDQLLPWADTIPDYCRKQPPITR